MAAYMYDDSTYKCCFIKSAWGFQNFDMENFGDKYLTLK